MKITLIGMGSGCPESLTVQGYAALREADLILGARRLLSALPAGCTENRAAAYLPDEILELLHASGCENAALLYSGDTGFYSGASALVERLQAQGYQPVVLPGLSSVQMLSAALGRPWQDWKLVSAHGRALRPGGRVHGGQAYVLFDGRQREPRHPLCPAGGRGLWKAGRRRGREPGDPGAESLYRHGGPAGRQPFREPERAAGGGGPGAAPPYPGPAWTKPLRGAKCL